MKIPFEEISQQWDDDIIPQLKRYIEIPNKSPAFDHEWKRHGYMDQAMKLIVDWCKKQKIKDMKINLIEERDRTPLLLIDIPGQAEGNVLLYGHMDKQPEMSGWEQDLGPWKPVIKNEKLYGRGGADDGYAIFCAITAIASLQRHNIPHPRCVVLIEASEESGSSDLPYYLTQVKDKIGTPHLIICLDSGCANYQQLWGTTSLRGLVGGVLKIEVLKEGLHSGLGSGVAPGVFDVLRQLLDRIEDSKTGIILLSEFEVEIPEHRVQQAKQAAAIIGESFYEDYPLAGKTQPVTHDVAELILNNTWRSQLSIIGVNGIPLIENAGNVTLPKLEAKLSIRIPPTCNAKKAATALKKVLEANPPFQANVEFDIHETSMGWHAPQMGDWLLSASNEASMTYYQQPAAYLGCGGTIPFMSMLGEIFPKAQFLITGVLGPKSNAHGPNEFLHIPMAKRLTACVAALIAKATL